MAEMQRYELQWDVETYQLAERAAAAGGYGSIKALLTQLVRTHAPEVLAAYSHVQLSNEQFNEFNRLCQATVKPSSKIQKAVNALDNEGFSLNASE
ncbi:DUF1778 domain-containing protein [bacterium AH-315-K03]|nr:DUF1778 domain-containing protein [bacterium AH-315-K03]